MPASATKNNVKSNQKKKKKISNEKRNKILFWFKAMKFEWFSDIYKQNKIATILRR